MFKELINAYKLIQYGLSIKKQMGFAIGFASLGVIIELLTRGRQPVGSFYIVLSGLFIYQMIISADVSSLVQASPYKKKIQCFYPLIAVTPWTYIVFTIVVLIHALFIKLDGAETLTTHAANIFLIGCFLFVTMAYFGVSYKFFIASTLIMCFSIVIPLNIVNRMQFTGSTLFDSYGRCVALAYAFLTAGTVLSYIFSRLLYKYDLSPMAFRGVLGNTAKKK